MCDTTEVGPRGFGSDPPRIVACCDEEFGCSVVADSVDLEESGCGLSDQWPEHPVEPLRLLPQILDSMAKSSNGHVCGVSDRVVAFPRSQCRGFVDQGDRRQSGELGADLRSRGEHHMTQLVEGFDAGVDCGTAGDHQHPDRLHVPIPGLRRTRRRPGESSPGRGQSVDRIRLPVPVSGLPVRPVDLDDGNTLKLQIPRDTNPVRAGALHTNQHQLAMRAKPRHQLSIAVARRRKRFDTQDASQVVHHSSHMDIGVGVDIANNSIGVS